ncbi:MAG: PilN domain-containing protein [Chitinispirillaceae bacterium]|nr:PilN domain-containing protein [Chitinispirillaceae bacterium]
MRKRYGISVTDDDIFVCTALRPSRRGWRLAKVRRWNGNSFMRNYLQLHRRVHLALPCHWVRLPPSDTTDIVCSRETPFTACSGRTECDHFSETLGNNLAAAYPDDAFLATLPQRFGASVPDSFVSLFAASNAVKIGIVFDTALIAVFNVAAASPRELEGHIGRIERYLIPLFPAMSFPEKRYLLNEIVLYDESMAPAERLSCGSDDPAVLKAMGCALCETGRSVPRLLGPVDARWYLSLRTLLMYGAFLLFIAGGVAAASLFAYGRLTQQKVRAAQKAYRHLLATNAEISDLIAVGNDLSRQIMDFNRRASRTTTWGPFLQLIGSLRPSGLFLERLGSEPADGAASRFRIALAGWCENETVATDFIKMLNNSPLLSGVTLSSMERVDKQQAACRFKIVCVLSTIKN